MTIYVDGDACCVKELIIHHSKKYTVKVVMVISICHVSKRQKDVEYVIVDNENQSVDMMIINKTQKNDLVITDDYGLASLLLGKQVLCLSTRGFIYTQENIEDLLIRRYINMKSMRGGNKVKGPSKRSKEDDIRFMNNFNKILHKCLYNSDI
ncbi:YaiI/YqxD family protein [Inediibacterium massiliense]|uniref:YaiI/YqxD family protein n=1 Tax=Inediibacterium massiliense TaxID=1658111 RepID=UPI0006B6253E|nr:YaiI/YqxD family protein [Inediibacterium massiliense]